MSQITVRFDGRREVSVEDIPFGVTVRVEDYDTDGFADDETEVIGGQRALVTHYGSEAQQGNLAGVEPPNAVSGLLAAADELVALHGVEPGTVSASTVNEAVAKLAVRIAKVRAAPAPLPPQPRTEAQDYTPPFPRGGPPWVGPTESNVTGATP